MRINTSGFVGVNTNDPKCHLQVNGIGNINNGSPYATANNNMLSGSLTIGGTNVNYGGGNLWNTNMAGFLMECDNNTEIAVHDAGHRLASLMYYEGGGNNRITIGRDMGWGGISSVNIPAGTLNFGSRISDFLINLWSTNEYGFGINASTLRYNVPVGASHRFYGGTANIATIDSAGNFAVN